MKFSNSMTADVETAAPAEPTAPSSAHACVTEAETSSRRISPPASASEM